MRKSSVHVRSKRQHLFYGFKWQGERCKEYTGLLDTTENRTRCQRMARVMSEEMALGTFDYLRHFPEASGKYKFSGRPHNKVTLSQYAENDWLAHIKTKVREKTAEEYLNDILIPRVFPSLGDIALKDIRPEHLDHFTGHLKTLTWHRSLFIGAREIEGRRLSPRRINIILLRVRHILDLAYERGYVQKNPHGWITLQKERRPDIDPLSFEERAIFLQTVPARWQPYFIVAFDTGMRPSEQMALHWRNVDFTAKRLFIRHGIVRGKITDLKTDGSWRDMDMLPTVEEALRNLPDKRGYVFPNTEGGFLDLTNLRNRVWYPTLKAAGLRPRDLYLCRHTFASLMLQAGEDPAWIARMLGHTTTRMLYERYGKFIKNRTRQDGSAYVKVLMRGGN